MHKIKVWSASLLLVMTCSNTNAALLNVVDHGDYFTDTLNGLDWLDLSFTARRSFNDVSSRFGAGEEFEGWRYATAVEFGAMWDSITGETSNVNAYGAHSEFERGEVIDLVIDMFGDSLEIQYGIPHCEVIGVPCDGNDWRSSRGMLADLFPPDNNTLTDVLEAAIVDADLSATDIDYVTLTQGAPDNLIPDRISSYLVRDTQWVPFGQAPAPAPLAMLALGVLGLGVFSRKYKKTV